MCFNFNFSLFSFPFSFIRESQKYKVRFGGQSKAHTELSGFSSSSSAAPVLVVTIVFSLLLTHADGSS
jgi:hypothetical protein